MHETDILRKSRATLASALASLGLLATGCERAPMKPHYENLQPPAQATGVAVATVDFVPPAGNANRTVYAALKRDGRIVARGDATVPATDTAQIILRALDAATLVPDGEYDLWMTINRDELESVHPSFGDLYVREKWLVGRGARAKALTDSTAWKERALSKPENRITIHYRRYDEDYADVGIWTWDGHYKKTPEQNEIYEVARDDYGLIFEIDRGEYGDSDQIGLLPRLHASWDGRDGDDKFWRAAMGAEVWLIGTKSQIFTEKPDTSPMVAAAFIDAPNRLVAQVSRLVGPNEVDAGQITVEDDQGHRAKVATVRVLIRPGHPKSNYIELTTAEPIDLAHRSFKIGVEGFVGSASAVPRGVLDDPELFYASDAVLGATYAREATTFRVFAPASSAASVVLYDEPTGDAGRVTHALKPAGQGVWEGRVAGNLKGKFYVYSFDGPNQSPDREALDIYAINAVNSSRRARITDLAETNPDGWEAGKAGPAVESPVDMVIYEMHVRDMTIAPNSPARVEDKGKYLGFAETADYLKELGVTHVQLMPLQDFENDETSTNYNWGYVTTVFNSPEGWFASNVNDDSRVREFKQLVAALHARGIGVIMDVVYNHTAAGAPFNFHVPRYYFRFLPDGAQSNGSGCGNDFRSEAPMARKYILDSLKFWVEEYGIDGFRFDLMALLDLDTMKQADRELRALNPDIVLYGEPWGGGGKQAPVRATNKHSIRGTKIGAFNDAMRNALVGSPFDKNHGGFVQEGNAVEDLRKCIAGAWRMWGDGPHQVINYMSCHDNYTVWDKLKHTNPKASDADLKEMMKLGYLLLFTSQGVPFMHGGEEFGRTKQGHENSYNAPDSINQVDWSLKEKHADLFAYTRALIALRKAHPIFRLRAKEQIAAWLQFHETGIEGTLMFTLDGTGLDNEPWRQVCVIANSADALSHEIALPAGTWRVAFDAAGPADNREVTGSVRLRYKSGMILFQL
jgi:pullulanase